MKKTLYVLLASVILLSLFLVPCFAEELDTQEETPAETQNFESTSDTEINTEAIVGKLTNTSFCVTLGTTLLAAVGVLATVKKNIDNIKSLVSTKSDSKQLLEAFTSAKDDIYNAYNDKLAEVNKTLEAEKDENKKLTAILAIAFTNMKNLPESTKSEIVALLNDVHKATGTASEIVEKAQEYIDKAEETVEKIATPALDLLEEDKGYIEME